MAAWIAMVEKIKHPSKTIEIALVGKYTELPDAYKSICESFVHAGAVNDCKVKLSYVNSERIDASNVAAQLGRMSGILVAPGFGNRGIEGKIEAVRFARENGIPFFGICLGMQCAVIEFARHVLGLADANSSEMEQTPHPVIDLMEEQKGITAAREERCLAPIPCMLHKGLEGRRGLTASSTSPERHRHRYEFNNDYLALLGGRRRMKAGCQSRYEPWSRAGEPPVVHRHSTISNTVRCFQPLAAVRVVPSARHRRRRKLKQKE